MRGMLESSKNNGGGGSSSRDGGGGAMPRCVVEMRLCSFEVSTSSVYHHSHQHTEQSCTWVVGKYYSW